MAKDENGKWVTIKGTPVFIKEGWTLSQAFANRKKNPKSKKKTSEHEKFVANKNKYLDRERMERIIDRWSSEGFEEGKYHSPYGKGVFHQKYASGFLEGYGREKDDFVIREFDLGSAPEKEALDDLNDMLSEYGYKAKYLKEGTVHQDIEIKKIKPKGKKLLDGVVKQSENPKSGYEQFLANENGLKIGKGQENILGYDLKKQAVKYKADPTSKNKSKYRKMADDYLDFEHRKDGMVAKDFNGEYRTNEYGDRFYKEDTIKPKLNELTDKINNKWKEVGVDFKTRVQDGNIELYDATETMGSDWCDGFNSFVKESFGDKAYLEPINNAEMSIAGVYVDKENRWEDTWAKENGKSAQDMTRIERAIDMYEDGDIGEDELKDYFKDWNEMRSYQYNKARDERRNAFFSKDAYSKENMKKKDEIIAKQRWGDYDSTFGQIARDSALPIFQMDNLDPLKKQLEGFQEHVKSGDGYNKENLEDTITRLKNLNSASLTAQFLEDRSGEKTESYARKKYGDDKVDTALWLENQLMGKGYNKIYTQLEPSGMINDRNHVDMIIKGDMPEKNLSIAYNFNDKGEAVISLQGMSEPGVYGELILNDKNAREIRDITSGSSIGGYPVIEQYALKNREPKLTTAEKKEYYDKVNAYYKEHYSDGYNEYARKVREDIIKKRG